MRSSMDYTSPDKDSKLSSSQIGERVTRDHLKDHDKHQSTITNTVTPTHHHHHQTLGGPNMNYPNPDPISTVVTWYRECQKNHAAASGGHVLDGCGEFMPSGTDENSPASLKCAACECHRSFHRRETDNSHNTVRESQLLLPHQYQHHHQHRGYHHHHHHRRPVMMMAFGGAESSSDDLNSRDPAGRLLFPVSSAAKKRFRTKFNRDQKEKMTELAERLGWRIQKHDEQEVQRFCSEVGVKRQVLKVWMHNNKQSMKKKDDDDNNHNNSGSNDSNHKPHVNTPIT